MDDYKENENLGYKNEATPLLPGTPKRPLSTQSSMNSLNTSCASPVKVETMSPLRQQKYKSLASSYSKLERQYADLLLRSNGMMNEIQHLEDELREKVSVSAEQKARLSNAESIIKRLENEYAKNKELFEKEIQYYQEANGDLQAKIARIREELALQRNMDSEIDTALPEKYNTLLKEYKVIKSNYELEKNSKLVLMDQIEYLTKENEYLKDRISSLDDHFGMSHEVEEGTDDSVVIADKACIGLYGNGVSSRSAQDTEYDSDGSDLLCSLAEDIEGQLESSSPIKEENPDKAFMTPREPSNQRFSSIEHNPNFQFPPSPDPNSKILKRQSLPVKLKHNSLAFEANQDFVLSPLKLTNNTSYFENSIDNILKLRSPGTKTHSRYNSHDILPIKVEFEPTGRKEIYGERLVESEVSQPNRNESMDDIRNGSNDSVLNTSIRNKVFEHLNGYNNTPSNRSSLNTVNSSKRSGSSEDCSFTNDTKQEIMKLKFELHSLKLHNEKLLSYIGFELQKQSKNIKKLSHKQSAGNLRNRKIEYSDAKLIEKSRDVLINKKRVLRSVSVNPILSKKYSKGNFTRIFSKGLIPFQQLDPLSVCTPLMTHTLDEDDYGFMKHHDNFFKRLFSSDMDQYLHIDDIDESLSTNSSADARQIKKYRSQIFPDNAYDSSFDSSQCSSLDQSSEACDDDDEWEDITNEDPLTERPELAGIFSHLRSLIPGYRPSSAKGEMSVDDGLKYKFLSIAIGIMIIGLRCAEHSSPSHVMD